MSEINVNYLQIIISGIKRRYAALLRLADNLLATSQEKTSLLRLNNIYGRWCMFRGKWNIYLSIIHIKMTMDIRVFENDRIEWGGVQRVE